eukprot:g30510.t1
MERGGYQKYDGEEEAIRYGKGRRGCKREEDASRKLPVSCGEEEDGLKALCFFLSRRPYQFPSTDTLISLTKLILTLNNFSFNASHFLQTEGVAMCTRIGPSYAWLF